MKKILFIAGILILSGAVVMAMSDYIKLHIYRYKITINIETPDGIKSGSAIRELIVQQQPRITPETTSSARTRGEAVVIDMGNKGALFGLINYDSYYELLYAFDYVSGAFTDKGLEFFDNLKVGQKAELTKKQYWPRLVRFKDINDPMSVEQVWGTEFDVKQQEHLRVDRLEDIYGAGSEIKSVTVEITDEKIKWGSVDKFLPRNFGEMIKKNWKDLPRSEKTRLVSITTFKIGEKQ